MSTLTRTVIIRGEEGPQDGKYWKHLPTTAPGEYAFDPDIQNQAVTVGEYYAFRVPSRLPQGCTITSASFTFEYNIKNGANAQSADYSLTLEDAANSKPWPRATPKTAFVIAEKRPTMPMSTNGTISFPGGSPPGPHLHTSPSMAAHFQRLVDKPDYEPGSYLNLFLNWLVEPSGSDISLVTVSQPFANVRPYFTITYTYSDLSDQRVDLNVAHNQTFSTWGPNLFLDPEATDLDPDGIWFYGQHNQPLPQDAPVGYETGAFLDFAENAEYRRVFGIAPVVAVDPTRPTRVGAWIMGESTLGWDGEIDVDFMRWSSPDYDDYAPWTPNSRIRANTGWHWVEAVFDTSTGFIWPTVEVGVGADVVGQAGGRVRGWVTGVEIRQEVPPEDKLVELYASNFLNSRADGTTFRSVRESNNRDVLEVTAHHSVAQSGRPFGVAQAFRLDTESHCFAGWFFNPSRNKGDFRIETVYYGTQTAVTYPQRDRWTRFATPPHSRAGLGPDKHWVQVQVELNEGYDGDIFYVDDLCLMLTDVREAPFTPHTHDRQGIVHAAKESEAHGMSVRRSKLRTWIPDAGTLKPRREYVCGSDGIWTLVSSERQSLTLDELPDSLTLDNMADHTLQDWEALEAPE